MPKKTNINLDSHKEILKEWHPKNAENPSELRQYSNKKVWWKCSKVPSHEWEARISNRVKDKSGCPYCRGVKISSDNNLLVNFDNIPDYLVERYNKEVIF